MRSSRDRFVRLAAGAAAFAQDPQLGAVRYELSGLVPLAK